MHTLFIPLFWRGRHLQQRLQKRIACLTSLSCRKPASPPGGWSVLVHPCSVTLRMHIRLRKALAARSAFLQSHELSLCAAAWVFILTWRMRQEEERSPCPVFSSPLQAEGTGTSACSFWEHIVCPVWKLRLEEHLSEQLVGGCCYHLNCRELWQRAAYVLWRIKVSVHNVIIWMSEVQLICSFNKRGNLNAKLLVRHIKL